MTGDGDSDPAAVAASFLAERENGADALEALLAVDAEHDTWTFDDVALDSGEFGEVVSRGIVESAGDEYRVADPEALRTALEDADAPNVEAPESSATERRGHGGAVRSWPDVSRPELDLTERFQGWLAGMDRRAVAGLLAALALVAAARMTGYAQVFQHGQVISPVNDPYYFRYWLEQLLAESNGITDYGVLKDPAFGTGEVRPGAHATNWFLAELLGGDESAARTLAAWLPVVASVALGAMLYRTATLLTRDVRVGIASVVVFALAPVHAVYTGLGFFDHQFHQYFWLGATLLALTWLATDVQRRWSRNRDPSVPGHLRAPRTWAVAAALGISIAMGTHAWGGSPLLLIPLAAYIALRVAMDVREGLSPAATTTPTLAGIALGAAIAGGLNEQWGWHQQFVSWTPAMVLGGSIAVLAAGELWRRQDWHLGGLLAVDAAVFAAGLLAFREFLPKEWSRAQTRLDDLLFREGITETMSLFSTEFYVIFGPLYQIGVSFYVGLAVLGWVGYVCYRRYEPGWLLLGVYTACLLVIAGIQVRFAGQLVIVLSVLAGLGLVRLLAAVDLARLPLPMRGSAEESGAVAAGATERTSGTLGPPGGRSPPKDDTRPLDPSIAVPDLNAAAYVLGIGLLVLGLNLVYVPSLTAQVTHGDSAVDAALAIDDDSEARNLSYPGNYVLSQWDDNRMYNYVVSGESQGYGYARNQYGQFLSRSDPTATYQQYSNRVGYVVVTDVPQQIGDTAMAWRLLGSLQSASQTVPALSHYRLLYVDGDRSIAAYALVPGARITGQADSGGVVVPVQTSVEIDGTTFTYQRTVTASGDGSFAIRVPYPGEYTVGGQSVTVPESAVTNGTAVSVG